MSVAAAETMTRNTDTVYSSFTPIEHFLICGAKVAFAPCFLCNLTKVDDYERVVILRLGKRLHKEAGTGGLYVVWPCIDNLIRVDTRENTVNIPGQSIITSEGLTVRVDGVVFYTVKDAVKAVFGVEDYTHSVIMLAQTKLREVLGTKTFEELQNDKDAIVKELTNALDLPTNPWGIRVNRVELTDVGVPGNLQRAMGQEAEATRKARSKVIEAQGEKDASQILLNAANKMQENPAALQLRFLQTLTNVAAENNKTVIMPYPSELTTHPTAMAGATSALMG